MAFSYSPKIVTDGLVLYLDAGNPYSYVSGSTNWNDLSRSQTNGTLVNGPTYSSANLGSIVLDGVDDFVDLGTASTSTIRGGTQFTLNYWFRKQSSNSDFNLGAWDQTFGKGFFIQWFADSNVYFGVSTGGRLYSNTGLTYTANWYNFTLVFDGTLTGATNIGKLYINGISQTLSNSGGMSTTVPTDVLSFYVGKLINYGSVGKGDLSTLQLYNRALSAQEVLQNYNATKTRFGL